MRFFKVESIDNYYNERIMQDNKINKRSYKMKEKIKNWIALGNLQDESIYFVQNEQQLSELLQSLSINPKYAESITGACIIAKDGEYIGIWLTEESRFYDLLAIYHPLPYYMDSYHRMNRDILPEYWQDSNPLYCANNPKIESE